MENIIAFFKKLFRRKPKPPTKKFVKIGNRLVEFTPPPDHIPREKMEAMQKRARELKIKQPQMSLERIQRKVCEEFHITIDKTQELERIEIEGAGTIIKRK